MKRIILATLLISALMASCSKQAVGPQQPESEAQCGVLKEELNQAKAKLQEVERTATAATAEANQLKLENEALRQSLVPRDNRINELESQLGMIQTRAQAYRPWLGIKVTRDLKFAEISPDGPFRQAFPDLSLNVSAAVTHVNDRVVRTVDEFRLAMDQLMFVGEKVFLRVTIFGANPRGDRSLGEDIYLWQRPHFAQGDPNWF